MHCQLKMTFSESGTKPNFSFIVLMVHKMLKLLDLANKMLQAENIELLSAIKFVNCASDCARKKEEFVELWRISCDLAPTETKQKYVE